MWETAHGGFGTKTKQCSSFWGEGGSPHQCQRSSFHPSESVQMGMLMSWSGYAYTRLTEKAQEWQYAFVSVSSNSLAARRP